jgi:hypothetical protein
MRLINLFFLIFLCSFVTFAQIKLPEDIPTYLAKKLYTINENYQTDIIILDRNFFYLNAYYKNRNKDTIAYNNNIYYFNDSEFLEYLKNKPQKGNEHDFFIVSVTDWSIISDTFNLAITPNYINYKIFKYDKHSFSVGGTLHLYFVYNCLTKEWMYDENLNRNY